MKRLITSILILLCFSAKAQFPTDLAAMRALNITQYSCGTFHCIPPAIEKFQHDTLYGLMNRLYGLVVTAGDLQAVTTLGNTSSNDILVNNSFFSPFIAAVGSNGAFQVRHSTLPFFASLEGNVSTLEGQLELKSTNSFYSTITPTVLTAPRAILTPDEGSGSGIASTVVLHTTKDNINVNSGGLYQTTMSNSGAFTVSQSGVGIGVLAATSGFGVLSLKASGSAFYAVNYATGLSATRTYIYPDEGNGVGLASTYVLHITKDPISVAGFNDTTVVDTQFIQFNNGVTQFQIGSNPFGGYAQFYQPVGGFNALLQATHISGSWSYSFPNERGGDLAVRGDGVSPHKTVEAAMGIGATCVFGSNCSDVSGLVSMTYGSGVAVGKWLTITYNTPYDAQPHVVLQAANGPSIKTGNWYTQNETTTGFEIWINSISSLSAGAQNLTYIVSR